jgi:ATP-dependent exoDNAse (exonuclease V) beta subunit
LSEIGQKPLRRLVEGCWIALGGPACVDALGFEAVQSFLLLLGEQERGGGLDNLGDLVSRVQELYAPPDPGGENPVQIMTIHKSKGLQFDNVILPRLDGTPPHRSERLFLWLENAGPSQDDFLIAPLKERGADEDPTYRYLQNVIDGKERNEYHRLLYVAVTRARQRLFLTASLGVAVDNDGMETLRPPRANSFLHALWPFLNEATAERFENREAADQGSEEGAQEHITPITLRRLRDDWRFPAFPGKPEITAEGMPTEAGASARRALPPRAGLEARLAGVAVHRLLAALGRKGPEWWLTLDADGKTRAARRQLRQLGYGVAQPEIVQRIVRAIDNTVRDERGLWLLSAHAEARSEWAVTGNVNGRNETVIVDRTFVDDEGIRWIIDFKSAEHEGGDLGAFLAAQEALHTEQLHRYSRIVEELDTRPQRLALYFPLLLAWRELPEPAQGELPPSS